MPQLNFNALASEGPQGVYQGFMQGQQLQNQLARQQQAAQLGELQLQNALREQRLAGEEEAAYKAAGGDYKRLQSELMQRGLGKQALAVGAQQAKMRSDQLTQQKTQFELVKNAANQVFANPQNAAQILTSFGQRTGIDMSDDLAQLQQLGNNPEAVKQWAAGIVLEADKMLPKFQQISAGGSTIVGTVNPLDARFKPVSELQHTMTPSEAINAGLRAQEVGLRGREVNLREQQAQLQREGIEGITPKELQKRNADYPAATAAIKGVESKSDAFVKDLKALRDHPGLGEITGMLAGRVNAALSKDGRAALALYDKVTAKGGFQALQDMRAASKTGGALGNVSNQEGKQLVSSFAAINRTQDAADVQAALDTAIGDVEGAKARMREAYDSTYAYKNRAAAPAAPAANAAGGVDINNPLLK